MRILTPLTLAAALVAAPALAEFRETVKPIEPIEIFRDSDGDILSVLYPGGVLIDWQDLARMEVVYFTQFDTELDSGPVILAPTDAGGLPTEIQANDTTYAVEQSGNRVYLRDVATGVRVQAQRLRPNLGDDVNPQRFGLD